jgi:diguanylate cyclase (GGDEF)-like protein
MATNIAESHKTARRNKPILSIRARLLALALLAVVPLMLERMHGLELARADHVQHAHNEAIGLARRGAEAQREAIYSVRALVQVLAHSYVMMAAKGEKCGAFLTDFTANVPWIRSVSIVGNNGRITCSTTPLAVGLDVSDRAYLKDAIAKNDFVISNYLITRALRTPTVVAAFPARADDDRPEGVVIASIDLQWINDLLATARRRDDGALFVVDGHGTVIAATEQDWIGKRVGDQPAVKEILAHDDGTLTANDFGGVRRIFGYVQIPWTDARLAVGLDEHVVLSRVDREIGIAYLQFGLFGVLVLLIAWFGGEQLVVQPIRSLARTAARFGRGDLKVRDTQEPLLAEFEPLARALDDMARKLAAREEELHIANQHLDELASLDGLTGLANRRGFDMRLEQEWQQAAKTGKSLALMMIDIDHFKLFNDRYGHVVGDSCLRRVGETLSIVSLKVAVLVTRYGGEEFALLLPGIDFTQAVALAEQARRAIEDLHIAHAEAPCGRVTISIGVAALVPGFGEPASRLVEAADAGLYAAKRRGRNTVVAHAPVELAVAS